MITLSLAIENHLIRSMFSILQGGFMVRALVGRSIGEFLREQYGLSSEYIAKRISTIFLNGEPVDNIDTAILREGSTMALSGAMPGLVGAVMRSGSYYASFRDTITHRDSGEAAKEGEGIIRVKLFNIVMSELGAGFLRRGIYLNSTALRDFLSGQGDDFWQGCSEILLNQETAEPDLLRKGEFLSEDDLVFVSVKTID